MISTEYLPDFTKIKNGQIFEINKTLNSYTHGIFKYPAKFTPTIPNWFLKNFTKEGDSILDCFCGSGTSLVEASLLKRKPLGIDFDPLSQLITLTKTTHLNKKDIFLIENIYKNLVSKNKKKFFPDLENLDHWFQMSNLKILSDIINNINDLKGVDEKILNFFKVTFASIVRKSSNADNVSPKPYVSKRIKKTIYNSRDLFLHSIEKNLNIFKNAKIIPKYSARIIGNDARKIKFKRKIDHIICSPPYINSFDYVRILRLENLWLKHFTSSEIINHKKKQIGNELIPKEIYQIPPKKIGILELDKIIQEIYKLDKIRSHTVANYFFDMEKNFIMVKEKLSQNGYYCIVIGDCVIKNIKIETYKFFIKLMKKHEYKFIKHFSYVIKNPYLRIPRSGKGGKTVLDHIIVMKKING